MKSRSDSDIVARNCSSTNNKIEVAVLSRFRPEKVFLVLFGMIKMKERNEN